LPNERLEGRLSDDVTIDSLNSTDNRVLLGVLIFAIRYVGAEDNALLVRDKKM
jgi:hypothetical protein